MNPRKRLAVIVLAAGIAVALAAVLFVKQSSVPEDPTLKRSIARFMQCLPDDLSDSAREEIDGIMARFYAKALSGGVHLEDIDEIQWDLARYDERGEITRAELIDFMAKVGRATRRMDDELTPRAH